MAAPGVLAGNVLTAGLRTEFADAYNKSFEASQALIAPVMQTGIPSDKLTETFGYFESAAYPRLWRRGETPHSKGFKSRNFSVTNKDWVRRVDWNEDDRQDDQTRSLLDRARDAGRNWGLLDELVFFQILQAATDNDLLEAIPNAPDGVALYYATDGDGAARFGVTNGNLLTGAGVAAVADVQADYYRALSQMAQFQDTNGKPLWGRDVLDGPKTILTGAANKRIFTEAFKSDRPLVIVENAVSAENVAAATPRNVTELAGAVKIVETQLITTNDWFVFLDNAPKKAIFSTSRQPLREILATMDNSDRVRDTKEEFIQWDSRAGYGVFLPYQTVKIDN